MIPSFLSLEWRRAAIGFQLLDSVMEVWVCRSPVALGCAALLLMQDVADGFRRGVASAAVFLGLIRAEAMADITVMCSFSS